MLDKSSTWWADKTPVQELECSRSLFFTFLSVEWDKVPVLRHVKSSTVLSDWDVPILYCFLSLSLWTFSISSETKVTFFPFLLLPSPSLQHKTLSLQFISRTLLPASMIFCLSVYVCMFAGAEERVEKEPTYVVYSEMSYNSRAFSDVWENR